MNAYVFRLVPPRPTFAFDMNDDERSMMGRHGVYWRERRAGGEVVAFGPVNGRDGNYGIAIVRAADDDAARRVADADPALLEGFGFATEIEPMLSLITPEDLPAP
jgi:uncharacterized protein YciI